MKSYLWKVNPTYSAIHKWIVRNYGSANYCSANSAHIHTNYDWANLSGEYKRDIQDWKQLCRKCHVRMDMTATRKQQIASEASKFRKRICQYDANGNFVSDYEYILQAANKLKIDVSGICKVLKGKRNSAGGFSFRYL